MSLQKVARIGDTVTGICNGSGHAAGRAFTGTWQTGSPNVFANEIPIVRLNDTGITDCGHHFYASTASAYHKANNIFIHRVTDQVIVVEGGSGTTITGSPTVDCT